MEQEKKLEQQLAKVTDPEQREALLQKKADLDKQKSGAAQAAALSAKEMELRQKIRDLDPTDEVAVATRTALEAELRIARTAQVNMTAGAEAKARADSLQKQVDEEETR